MHQCSATRAQLLQRMEAPAAAGNGGGGRPLPLSPRVDAAASCTVWLPPGACYSTE